MLRERWRIRRKVELAGVGLFLAVCGAGIAALVYLLLAAGAQCLAGGCR